LLELTEKKKKNNSKNGDRGKALKQLPAGLLCSFFVQKVKIVKNG